MKRGSDDPDAGRAFDEFDFITVWGIDENETAAGRACGRPVRDSNLFGAELFNDVVKAFDLKGQMDQVFLNSHRST